MDIIQTPNHILLEPSEPVTDVNNYVKEVANELIHVLNYMKLEGLVIQGVSAVQVGKKIQVIAVRKANKVIVLVNPRIVKYSPSGNWDMEKCLSIMHGRHEYNVFRYNRVVVEALDLLGGRVRYVGLGLFGRVLQHEIDHLSGILISNRSKETISGTRGGEHHR